jgi:hypothetical protein
MSSGLGEGTGDRSVTEKEFKPSSPWRRATIWARLRDDWCARCQPPHWRVTRWEGRSAHGRGWNLPTGVGCNRHAARQRVNGKRLWAGGVATALVAALVAAVALLVETTALDVKPVAPSWLLGDGKDWTLTTRFAVTAAVSALAATALLHLLVLTTPRPRAFFGWIVTLVTVAAAVTLFAVSADASRQFATAATIVAVGIVVGTLLSAVLTSAQTVANAP